MKLKPQFVMATPTMQNSIEFRMRIEGSENWSLTKHSRASMRLGKLFEAAEDLLEASKNIFKNKSYSSEGTEGEFYVFLEDMDLLEKAIAKAESAQ